MFHIIFLQNKSFFKYLCSHYHYMGNLRRLIITTVIISWNVTKTIAPSKSKRVYTERQNFLCGHHLSCSIWHLPPLISYSIFLMVFSTFDALRKIAIFVLFTEQANNFKLKKISLMFFCEFIVAEVLYHCFKFLNILQLGNYITCIMIYQTYLLNIYPIS